MVQPMDGDQVPAWAARIRAERRARRWGVPTMADRLIQAADPADRARLRRTSLIRQIRSWEAGEHCPGERHRMLYAAALDINENDLFGDGQSAGRSGAPAMSDAAAAMPTAPTAGWGAGLRLEGLSSAQFTELISYLRDQWHALVKADNLLGPQHALAGVHEHLGVIGSLLRTSRFPVRREVLGLGARYAESAAWLHEDIADMTGSRYWAARSMEWAVEADDGPMVSWTLFRRSQQATADGDAAQVIGLAEAARRDAGGLPDPMLSAILQQEAHGYALEGSEVTCHMIFDRAHALAAAPDDPGDARDGHGSFCTSGYLEMQRAGCWLILGQPAKAVTAFEVALRTLPSVYRRDRGVALAGLAAALVATDEPERAARVAMDALTIARGSGSARILDMVKSASVTLAPHDRLPGVADLLTAVAGTPAA